MLEQQGNQIRLKGAFKENKVGKTGLTVTVNIWRNGSLITTAGSATEQGDGIYYFDIVSGNVNAEGYYEAVFKTATTSVDSQWVYSQTWVDKAGVENLDGTISGIPAAVWDRLTSAITTAGSIGKLAKDALPNAVAGATGGLPTVDSSNAVKIQSGTSANQVDLSSGKVNLQADQSGVTIGTVNAFAAAAKQSFWSVLASAQTGAGELGKLLVDNIDAAISSRLASASYTTPPTAAANADAVWDEDLTTHTATDSTGEALTTAAAGGSAPDAATIADAVWDEPLSGHATSGSTGEKLTAAGGAGDPWSTTVGGYPSGTFGEVIPSLIGQRVEIVSPVARDGLLEFIAGYDYSATDSHAIDFDESNGAWGSALDLTGSPTIKLTIRDVETFTVAQPSSTPWTGTAVVNTGTTRRIRFQPTAAESTIEPGKRYVYEIAVTGGNIGSRTVPLSSGRAVVRRRIAA